jgi:hypothetical protein
MFIKNYPGRIEISYEVKNNKLTLGDFLYEKFPNFVILKNSSNNNNNNNEKMNENIKE